jgi:tRNA modification GTPase
VRGQTDDPIVAAAEIALTLAPTERVATVLWDQRQGALRQAIERLVGHLSSGRLSDAMCELDDLLAWRGLGIHLTDPWRVVLAGRPNVGKSSLINALVGYQRAIVHPTPGTTRDLVTATTAWDGWPVELVDTAGLHAAVQGVEAAGVALAREHLATADLVLLVLDASNPLTAEDRALLADWPAALVVLNKCDLCGLSEGFSVGGLGSPHTRVSAQTGQGLDALQRALVQRLVPHDPPRGQAVPFQGEQVAALQAAVRALAAAEPERAIAELRRQFGGPVAC